MSIWPDDLDSIRVMGKPRDPKKVIVNTREGENIITTNILKGELKAIIAIVLAQEEENRTTISSNKVSVQIYSEYGYKILKMDDLERIEYVPVVTKSIDESFQGTQQWSTFFLNEKLIIRVFGAKNQDVLIIFRMA